MAPTSKRKPRKTPTSSMLDLDFLRGLIEAIDESGIDSLEITRAGTRIRVSKTPPAAPAASGGASAPVTHIAAAPNSAAPAPPASAPAAEGSPAASGEAEQPKADDTSHLTEITSPMVGTFYRSPSPEAPPYIEVGSRVTKGQTLCILEAMKLMNELEAEVDGTVKQILVDNGDPVEYGQTLFLIDPSS